MNILVTGGNGRMARHIKSSATVNYLLPGRQELDLGSFNSIDNYLQGKQIDGIILNGYEYPPTNEITLENIREFKDRFENSNRANTLGTLYLYLKLKNNLKFMFFLTTGLNPEKEPNFIFYRNSKASVADMLKRITFKDKKVKVVFIHPGHMHDDYTFKQSALQFEKLVEKVDTLENLACYAIFDKDKMKARKLESIFSYNTLETIEL